MVLKPSSNSRSFTVVSAVFSAGQTMVTAVENAFLGSETGQILAQFLRDDRGTAKNWQDIGKLESN